MRKLARKYLSIDHICIQIGRAGSAHSNVVQRASPLRPLIPPSANFNVGHLVRPGEQKTGNLRPSSLHATFSYPHLLQLKERC
jgi:hypothetical protein